MYVLNNLRTNLTFFQIQFQYITILEPQKFAF